jgi:hypothetical protein
LIRLRTANIYQNHHDPLRITQRGHTSTP